MASTIRRRPCAALLTTFGLLVSLLARAEAVTGVLENPSNGSFQSGIGVVSGWLCDAQKVTVVIDEGRPSESILEAAYGTARGDTVGVCGDANNGFGVLFNWGLLGDGEHTAVAKAKLPGSASQVTFGTATFTVTTLGARFLTGLQGRYVLSGLPDAQSEIGLIWQTGAQNFRFAPIGAVTSSSSIATPPPPALPAGAPLGALENPSNGSFQSGVGVVSGWVCSAGGVVVVIDEGTPNETTLETAYGTARGDTLPVCGDSNNGFGVLFNWGLLGDGQHTAVAKATGPGMGSGVAFGSGTFTVTTLGSRFVRGLSGGAALAGFPNDESAVVVEWQTGAQNLLITDFQDTHFPVEAGEVAQSLGIGRYTIRADESADPPLEIELRTPVGGLLGTIGVTYDFGTGDTVWTFVSHSGATAILRSNLEISEDGASVLTRTDLEALGRRLIERVQSANDPNAGDQIEEQTLETPLPEGAEIPTLGETHGSGGDLVAVLRRVQDGQEVTTDGEMQGWFEQTGLQSFLIDASATFVMAAFRDPNLSDALKVRFGALEQVGAQTAQGGAQAAQGVARPASFHFADDADPRKIEKKCTEVFGPQKGIACCDICTVFTPDLMPLGAFYTRSCTCCANLTKQRQDVLSACVQALNTPLYDDERCRQEFPPDKPWQKSVAAEDEHHCVFRCSEPLCKAHCESQGGPAPPPGKTYCDYTCDCPLEDPDAACRARHGEENYCGTFIAGSNGSLTWCNVAECGNSHIDESCPDHPELVEVCETFGSGGNVGCPGKRCSDDCRSCEPCECDRSAGPSGGCPGGQICSRDCTCQPAQPCALDPADRASAPYGTWCSESDDYCARGMTCDTATCRCKARGTCGDGVCDTAVGEQELNNPQHCPADCPVQCGDGKCNIEAGEADPVRSNYCAADCPQVQCCVDTNGCPSEEPFSCPGECCCCPAGAVCNRGGIDTPWVCGF